jgi:hypothetical protein
MQEINMYELYRRSNDLRDAIEHDVRRLLDPELSTEEKERIVRILWTMRETSERMDENIDSISQQNGL